MPIRILESHPLVEENRNQVAVHRGPLVYCLESKDLTQGFGVMDSLISDEELFETVAVEGLPGVVGLRTKVSCRASDAWQGELYRERGRKTLEQTNAKLIPYYAWGNRGSSEMSVWLSLK